MTLYTRIYQRPGNFGSMVYIGWRWVMQDFHQIRSSTVGPYYVWTYDSILGLYSKPSLVRDACRFGLRGNLDRVRGNVSLTPRLQLHNITVPTVGPEAHVQDLLYGLEVCRNTYFGFGPKVHKLYLLWAIWSPRLNLWRRLFVFLAPSKRYLRGSITIWTFC